MINYEIICKSVKGFHKKNKNQDYVGSSENPLIIALSDGHGGKKYIRSDIGAKLASKSLIEAMKKFKDIDWINDERRISQVKDFIVKEWRDSVLENYNKQKENENQEESKIEKSPTENDIYKLYGATLLGAMVIEKYIIYIQLGDGDIIKVIEENSNTDNPYKVERITELDDGIGEETESLCMKNASKSINIKVEENNPLIKLIMLSTDGYSKSFKKYDGFLKAGKDFLNLFKNKGKEYIEGNIEKWLKETTEEGSCDDITVGLIFLKENNPSNKYKFLYSKKGKGKKYYCDNRKITKKYRRGRKSIKNYRKANFYKQ